MESLDLTKKREELDLRKTMVLDLKKKINLDGVKANVIVVMDYSGSMRYDYEKGNVQQAVERILPLALAFDPDGKAPLYLFHDQPFYCGEMDQNNVFDAIKRAQNRVGGMGGTDFGPIIRKVVEDLNPNFAQNIAQKSASFLKSIFGKKEEPVQTKTAETDIPSLVLFFTDGETSNRAEVMEIMKKVSHEPVFFQFIGIGIGSQFLERLDDMQGRYIDNANYFKMPNINDKTDEEFYSLLLAEFPSYIQKAKQLNLLK